MLSTIRSMACLAALLLAVASPAVHAEAYEVTGTTNLGGTIKLDEPIDVNVEVGGVKLGSVFFDTSKMQAFAILQNRTPISVTPALGIAVFDAKGKLLGTGIDVSGFSFSGDKIGPGEQKNVVLSFNKFLNDFKNAATFQLVLSVGRTRETPGKPANVPNF